MLSLRSKPLDMLFPAEILLHPQQRSSHPTTRNTGARRGPRSAWSDSPRKYPFGPWSVRALMPKKKWLGGRYLATFSSNCFAINGNQVAALVAAAILVATSDHLKDGCRIHAVDFCSAFSLSCFQRVARAHAG